MKVLRLTRADNGPDAPVSSVLVSVHPRAHEGDDADALAVRFVDEGLALYDALVGCLPRITLLALAEAFQAHTDAHGFPQRRPGVPDAEPVGAAS